MQRCFRLACLIGGVAASAAILGGLVISGGGGSARAAPATQGAVGCSNSLDPAPITYPASGSVLPNVALASTTQNAVHGAVPARLSHHRNTVTCGAVFEDSGAPAPADDGDPNTVAGATIVFTLVTDVPGLVFDESLAPTLAIPCGSPTPAIWANSCQGAVVSGAGTSGPPFVITPNKANVVHLSYSGKICIPRGSKGTFQVQAMYVTFASVPPVTTLTETSAPVRVQAPRCH